MTSNQIAYWSMKENQRANLAKEIENERSNKAKEAETIRSNIAKETETHRANKANEAAKAVDLTRQIVLGNNGILSGLFS